MITPFPKNLTNKCECLWGRQDAYTAIKNFQNLLAFGYVIYVFRLRHYATSWEVAGSLPDEVKIFFNLPIPSCRIRARDLLSKKQENNISRE
jgi:hypothetical protein